MQTEETRSRRDLHVPIQPHNQSILKPTILTTHGEFYHREATAWLVSTVVAAQNSEKCPFCSNGSHWKGEKYVTENVKEKD